jgi:hypothetical protein
MDAMTEFGVKSIRSGKPAAIDRALKVFELLAKYAPHQTVVAAISYRTGESASKSAASSPEVIDAQQPGVNGELNGHVPPATGTQPDG